MPTPKKGILPREPTREDQFQREVPNRSIPDLLDALAELETATRPPDGAEAARGKDRKAVQALKLANELVRAVAGWAIDHQIGLALQGQSSALDVLSEMQRHRLNIAALARVNDHRHEIEGTKIIGKPVSPPVARQILRNLLQTNPGAFPSSVVGQTIEAVDALKYNETYPIFEPSKGRKKVGLTEVYLQLGALIWVEHYHLARGFKKYESLDRVAKAYRVTPATLRSWKSRVRKELGALRVDNYLKDFSVCNLDYEDQYDQDLISQGDDYQREIRKKK